MAGGAPDGGVLDGVELAVEAGSAKLRLVLALTDCYGLAAAKLAGARPVFRRREAEMLGVG